MHQRDVVGLAEQLHDFVRLVQPHQAMVDEDAGELLADRLMDQHGGDGRIHTAREAADHPVEADLLLDLVHHLGLEVRHRPVAPATADVAREISEQLRAIGRMHDFHVELRGVELAVLVGNRREGCPLGRGDGLEARGNGGDAVTMAHPHLVALARLPHAVEQRVRLFHLDEGLAEFAVVGRLDLAAQLGAHCLLAIADAENRKAAGEHPVRRPGAATLMHRGRATRQDDALEARPVEGLFGRLEGNDLRVDPRLADAPGDELGDLGAEVDDEDTVLHAGSLGKKAGVCKIPRP